MKKQTQRLATGAAAAFIGFLLLVGTPSNANAQTEKTVEKDKDKTALNEGKLSNVANAAANGGKEPPKKEPPPKKSYDKFDARKYAASTGMNLALQVSEKFPDKTVVHVQVDNDDIVEQVQSVMDSLFEKGYTEMAAVFGTASVNFSGVRINVLSGGERNGRPVEWTRDIEFFKERLEDRILDTYEKIHGKPKLADPETVIGRDAQASARIDGNL